MKRKIIIAILLISNYLYCCYNIYQTNITKPSISNKHYQSIVKRKSSKYWAMLVIPKINLIKELYPIDNPLNNVERNVTILNSSSMPNEDNSILILAAHSGPSSKAFFNDISKLSLTDKIIIEFANTKYIYEIDNYYEELKNGKIHVEKPLNNKKIVLTTCSLNNNNNQLVITGILTKSIDSTEKENIHE